MKNFSIYISLGILLIGQYFRLQANSSGGLFLVSALLFLFLYLLIKIILELIQQKTFSKAVFYDSVLLLMTVTIFAKYFYRTFWDYPALLVIPTFIGFFFYFSFYKNDLSRNIKIKAISGVYFIFTIPLFISPFDLPPRAYIPEEWYNPDNIDKAYKVNLPYSFELKETEDLSIAAFNLKQEENYEKAIVIYRQALKLEPRNPKLYFDLSECYAKNINLDKAISLLDTAITLDSSSAPIYNNRGLYHYQLNENYQAIKDYRIAIKLDSTNGMFYANLAMVLHKEDLYPEACACIRKAEELKFDITTAWRLKMIKKYCHQQNL